MEGALRVLQRNGTPRRSASVAVSKGHVIRESQDRQSALAGRRPRTGGSEVPVAV